MHELHFFTVMVNMLIVCAVCSIVVASILQPRRKDYQGLGRISALYGLHALGLCFLFLRGTLPLFWTSLVANSLIAAGFWIGLNGIEAFVGARPSRRLPLLAFLLFLALHTYGLYIQPDIHFRALNLSWFSILLSILSARRLLQPPRPDMLRFTRLTGLIYLAYAFVLILRTVIILTERGLQQHYLSSNTYESAFFIIFQIAYIFMTFFLLVMVNKRLVLDKEQALADVRTLSGLLPICSNCKNIRDDQGYWKQIEDYLHTHSDARFSHSICPACAKKLYPELTDELL